MSTVLVDLDDLAEETAFYVEQVCVPLITCKDCKYCEEVHYENEDEPPYVKLKCNSTRNTRFYRVEEDFYCGDGERK